MEAGRTFVYVTRSGTNSLICLNAKSGSSAWLFALHMAHDEYRFRNGSRLLITAHNKNLPRTVVPMPLYHAYLTPELSRFAIVRHPITRLLSGWLGKVVNTRRVNYHTAPLRFVSVGALNETFGAFVRHVVSNPLLVNLDVHFKLQSTQCAGIRPGVKPWRILRIEEVGAWYETLVCNLGISDIAGRGWETFATTHLGSDIRTGRPHFEGQSCMVRTVCGCRVDCQTPCTARSLVVEHSSFNDAYMYLQHYYTPQLAAVVNRWAAQDYAQFYYAPWTFGTSITSTVLPMPV